MCHGFLVTQEPSSWLRGGIDVVRPCSLKAYQIAFMGDGRLGIVGVSIVELAGGTGRRRFSRRSIRGWDGLGVVQDDDWF